MHTILAISEDDRLLITRKEVLRRTNSEVVAAKPEEAIELLQTRRFDLVVLCHSLTHEDTVEIASLAHQQTIAIPILKVMSSLEPVSEWIFVAPDAVASSDPRILIDKVAELLNVSLSRSNEEMLATPLAARHRDEMVGHEFAAGVESTVLHRGYLRG
jgi:CheY-like chemotaxis protein